MSRVKKGDEVVVIAGRDKGKRGVVLTVMNDVNKVIVENVNNFPGYISCDDKTISEIVVPVFIKNKLIAVLDIDGAEAGQFDAVDQKYLEEIVGLI